MGEWSKKLLDFLILFQKWIMEIWYELIYCNYNKSVRMKYKFFNLNQFLLNFWWMYTEMSDVHYQALDCINTFLSTSLYLREKPHGLIAKPNFWQSNVTNS